MVFIVDNSNSVNSKIDDYLNLRSNNIKSKKKMKVEYPDNLTKESHNYEQNKLYHNTKSTNQQIQTITKINRRNNKRIEKYVSFKSINKLDRWKNNSSKCWKQTRYNLRSRKK